MKGDSIRRKPGWLPGDPRNPAKRPEQRAQMSALRKGVIVSAETRARQSESMKRRLREPGMKEKWRLKTLGRRLSNETRRKIKEKKAGRPKKLVTMLTYMDSAFSSYIRLKYADQNGYVKCFTCEAVKPVSEMDCGHFVSRVHKATRWMDENNHPQCRYCNRYCEGRKDVYALRLVEKYGPDILSRLQEAKHQVIHIDSLMYEQFMAALKRRREELTEQMCPGWRDEDAKAKEELKKMGVELYEGDMREWWELPYSGSASENAKEMALEYKRVTADPDYT